MLSALGRAAMTAASRLRSGGLIVNEHTITLEQLRRHVDALGRWFEFIHPDDLPVRLLEPGKKPFCLLTFDDGHRSNATIVAPELARLGIPACFFLVTDFVGGDDVLWFTRYHLLKKKLAVLPPGLSPSVVKHLPHDVLLERLDRACRAHGAAGDASDDFLGAMTWDQARAMSGRGFAIGAHGVTHAVMTRQTRSDALANIARSIERVCSETGQSSCGFAFPNGNYTAELAQHALRCGARLVMTADPTWADADFPMWRLPRVQLFGDQDRATMEIKIALSAAGRFIRGGDGNGFAYRLVNRLARDAARPGAEGLPRAAPAPES